MISLLRGLMSSDGNTNRPLPSLILLGIVDFVCILIGAESINDRHFVTGTLWIIAGVGSALIGYYWPQIEQKLSKKPRRQVQAETPSPLPQSGNAEAQSEKREMVNVTPEHLIGFYNQGHTSIQASKLAEAFLGKWMVVSGPLGDILGNYEFQRMAVFSNRSIHKNNFVNMFFRDKERFGQLSTLKPGDKITVIGQLREVNSLEIFLENCELVDPMTN